jgi:hypothetical protein
MANPRSRFCVLFDIIGGIGLAAATAAMLAQRWLVVGSDVALMQMAISSLVMSVGSFMIARVAQMAVIVMTTPNPVELRARKAEATPAPTAISANVAKANELQRAA